MLSVNQFIFPLPIQSIPVPSSLDSRLKTTFWLRNWRLWASNPQMASPTKEAFCATPSTISDPIWNSIKKIKLHFLVACTRLFKSLRRLVGRSVGPSVGL